MLAIVGGLAVVWHLVPWAVRSSSVGQNRPEHIGFRDSPDGKLKAAIVTYAGGGAISPYCYQSISVVPAETPDQEAVDSRFEVYSGPCDSFALKEGTMAASPLVEWISDSMLRITISINSTALHPSTVRVKKRDSSGRVTVQFAAHQ
jgi:hypothetical protein